MSVRWVYSALGLIVVAWLGLYLSSYGVLVETAHTVGGPVSGISSIPVLRCIYFIGTGFETVFYDPVKQTVCPRLWSFGE